jgi:hypothetical protein
MSTTPDPGVQVATGDPGAIQNAADWHSNLADQFDQHAGTVSGAASSVASSWQGEAAASYQDLSTIVANHFHSAAATSRTAAASLRRYATELERCQREGQRALQEAEHWLTEQTTWQGKLDDANKAVHTAQGQVHDAQTALTTATAMGPKGAAAAGAAATRLHTAQDALTKAQDDQRKAQNHLDEATHQLAHWRRRGLQIWHEAQDAAIRATGELEPLSVPAPPLAGIPAPGVPDSFSLFPQSPLDWTGVGIGATSGYAATWAEQQIRLLRLERRGLLSAAARQEVIADSPVLSDGTRSAAASEARTLSSEAGGLASKIDGLGNLGRAATEHLGFGIGGLVDAAGHIADGQSPGKAAAEGAGSAVGGTAGAVAGAGACDSTGILAPVSPLCGAAGGAVGGWVGDKIGGLIGDL